MKKKKSSTQRSSVPEMKLHSTKGSMSSFAPMASGRLQKGAMKNYRGKGKP